MSKRLKAQTLADVHAFHSIVDAIAAEQADLAVLETRRDRAIQRIQARYALALAPINASIAAKLLLAQAYAEEHRAELLPKDKKSVELATATFGWRTGNRTVKPLGKKFTEEVIIALLEEKDLEDYVREVKEIAKDKILTDCTDGKTLTTPEYVEQANGQVAIPAEAIPLADVGLKITQSETFFIEPKAATGETLKAPEASAA